MTGTPGHYIVEFQNDLRDQAIAALVGNTSSLRSNGLHATATLDGGPGPDTYDVNQIGGTTNSLVNVFDSGGGAGDALTINGTDFADVYLMRAATADTGLAFIALINGPTPLTPSPGDPVERVNYNNNLEAITVNGGSGDDQFYIDDTRASITVNGDEGNDLAQVGQLYQSRRTPALAGVAHEDVFATIDTTQGWLSNGISFPMTINGGIGDDNFYVFHNLAILDLNGDDGNDTFLVQAFALAGSQEDHRQLTDLSGGAGADKIQYAVNAPVNIDGGDGFDTVIVIGTEFNDDFVVTATGVFGGGLNVNFVNIEKLVVDGGAGDDRFFVLGTGPTFTTEIDGGLGSDLVSVLGPTPGNGVISNDLLGHSGIITQSVESTETTSTYSGIPVVGISANVADNDTPGIVVIQQDNGSQIVQATSGTYTLADGTENSFKVVLTRPPDALTTTISNVTTASGSKDITVPANGFPLIVAGMTVTGTGIAAGTLVESIDGDTLHMTKAATASGTPGAGITFGNTVVVNIQPPEGLVLLTKPDGTPESAESGGTPFETIRNEVQSVTLANVTTGSFTLTFGADTTGPIAFNAAASDVQTALNGLSSIKNFNGGTTGSVSVKVTGTVYAVTFNGGQLAQTDIPQLTATPIGIPVGAQITVASVDGGFSQATGIGLTFDSTNWYIAQTVYYAVDDHAQTIGSNLDFQNSAAAHGNGASITGNVSSAISVDMNPNTTGDEYATLTAATAVFANDLPSSTLPEGLRGEQLKITGQDPEAEGQLMLVLGSYLTNLAISGASGTFTISFGAPGPGNTTTALPFNATASAIKAALEGLAGIGVGNVDVTGGSGNFAIALRGTLYLTNDVQFTASGTGGTTATPTIDPSTIKLASAWAVEPQAPAAFEVGLFADVRVPDMKVTVYSHASPSVVVFQTDGGTAVTQGGTTDTIKVRLSSQPTTSMVTVNLGDNGAGLLSFSSPTLTFTVAAGPTSWDTFQTVTVHGVNDGVIRGFHNADLSVTATGYDSFLSTVQIGDNNYPGVTVTQSGGSTNVVEYQDNDFGISQSQATTGGLPFQDTYTLSLTKQPDVGETVTVTVQAQPTRTSQTGGILSYEQQLMVCVGATCATGAASSFSASVNVSFTSLNWNMPVTVYVRALENNRVDGGDTHVFAPELNQLNAIQGPLFINGGEGEDRTGLLEREPVMLPGERNERPNMGNVVSSTPGTLDNSIAATVTIDPSKLKTVDVEFEPGTGQLKQDVAVNATNGTFTLSYGGGTTSALPYNAPAVTVENAIRSLLPGGWNDTVAANGNVYQVTFLNTGGIAPDLLGSSPSGLKPLVPGDLINETILITDGPAKNKSGSSPAQFWLPTVSTGR